MRPLLMHPLYQHREDTLRSVPSRAKSPLRWIWVVHHLELDRNGVRGSARSNLDFVGVWAAPPAKMGAVLNLQIHAGRFGRAAVRISKYCFGQACADWNS